MKIWPFIKILPSIFHFLLSLVGIWISSRIKFRRAKKAFKKELLNSGLPSEAVDSLVRSYAEIRKEFFRSLIQGARIMSRRSMFG